MTLFCNLPAVLLCSNPVTTVWQHANDLCPQKPSLHPYPHAQGEHHIHRDAKNKNSHQSFNFHVVNNAFLFSICHMQSSILYPFKSILIYWVISKQRRIKKCTKKGFHFIICKFCKNLTNFLKKRKTTWIRHCSIKIKERLRGHSDWERIRTSANYKLRVIKAIKIVTEIKRM